MLIQHEFNTLKLREVGKRYKQNENTKMQTKLSRMGLLCKCNIGMYEYAKQKLCKVHIKHKYYMIWRITSFKTMISWMQRQRSKASEITFLLSRAVSETPNISWFTYENFITSRKLSCKRIQQIKLSYLQ